MKNKYHMTELHCLSLVEVFEIFHSKPGFLKSDLIRDFVILLKKAAPSSISSFHSKCFTIVSNRKVTTTATNQHYEDGEPDYFAILRIKQHFSVSKDNAKK